MTAGIATTSYRHTHLLHNWLVSVVTQPSYEINPVLPSYSLGAIDNFDIGIIFEMIWTKF